MVARNRLCSNFEKVYSFDVYDKCMYYYSYITVIESPIISNEFKNHDNVKRNKVLLVPTPGNNLRMNFE